VEYAVKRLSWYHPIRVFGCYPRMTRYLHFTNRLMNGGTISFPRVSLFAYAGWFKDIIGVYRMTLKPLRPQQLFSSRATCSASVR
jgi:hypothetical protein